MAHADGRVDPNGRTIRNLLKVTYHDGGACVPLAQTARELVKVLLPRSNRQLYRGTADAVHQWLDLLHAHSPDVVAPAPGHHHHGAANPFRCGHGAQRYARRGRASVAG